MSPAATRRALLAGAGALAATPAVAAPGSRDWRPLALEVREAMRFAWRNYRERAWGADQIRPVSGGPEGFFFKDGRHLGLSLIEALDTLWLMGLDAEFEDGLRWVRANARYDVDGSVSVFETSIRLVGGLLSAHLASGEGFLLDKAHDLAQRLLPAFDTPTGLPWSAINLKTGVPRQPRTSPAGAGTFIAEWGTLSRLTGDGRFMAAAKRAQTEVFERRSKIDLVPVAIDVRTGAWLDRRATVGSYGDSFYEYLWDGWQLFGDADCKRMYDVCTAAILKHQRDLRNGDLWFADVDYETGAILNHRQDELASFYGGLLTQGGDARDGAAYTRSWAKAQARFGVLPEEYDYASGQATQVTNALRPELADSCLNIWLLDRDERWRAIGADHFRAMQRWCRAPYGYTGLADVTASPKRQDDSCPGYWWSEQMKYYWLLFSDTPRFDYRRNYLSTEGDVLQGFNRGASALSA
ncbi:MAG: glycoside hydrolase family 47 protein [Caulobacteraceae bacterium]|nr:glycoside hydrolase family 47 protein [Caulobacter sp.]